MALAAPKDPPPAYVETVEEITRIYKSLPPRPSIEDVAAAISILQSAGKEEQIQLEEIEKQRPLQDVPPELFSVLQEVKKAMVSFRSHEQRKEAAQLVEIDRAFQVFDGLIQKASAVVSGETYFEKSVDFSGRDVDGEIGRLTVIPEEKTAEEEDEDDEEEDNDVKRGEDLNRFSPIGDSSKATALSSEQLKMEKLNLMKVAAVIENTAKTGASVLDLGGKLMDTIEWLPLSLGKLSTLVELNLSENRLMALPTSICSLKCLIKLDMRANQLINLPVSFGELQNLTDLDLSGNLLKSLPESFGNLRNLISLDLSSNGFVTLPSLIGNLCSLQKLIVETNDLEELPYTIGSCLSLVELRLDFNQLKALPEAIGKLEHLEILTLHYNRVKRLPSTIGNLSHLKELDVSFNELENVPEALGFLASLKKLNVGKNFADLRMLPESIGNLEMLEELDISDNQMKSLPDSFRFLSSLKVFRADQTPLETPPQQIIKLGAQAVVQYVTDSVAQRDNPQRRKKKRGFCSYLCPLFCFGIEKS